MGGAERQMTLLIKDLPEEWERRIWSLGDGPFANVIVELGITLDLHKRKWRFDIIPFISLLKLLVYWKPCIVHSFGWLSSAVVAPLCKLLRIPFVDGSIRVGWVTKEHVFRARLALAMADCVIANSFAGLNAWRIPKRKGRVIYNGIDTDRFRLTVNQYRREDYFTVLMAGRMSAVKDFDSFVNSARLVLSKDSGQPWRFLALGDGTLRSTLMNKSADLVQKGMLIFVNPGLEVCSYLQEADVGVLMTNPNLAEEGCSNSILEYMACGLPVVCSDSGGNRELVEDGKTGFVIPPLNAHILANKLTWLKENPSIADQMGQAGKTRVFRDFTVEMMIQRTVNTYEELLHRVSIRRSKVDL